MSEIVEKLKARADEQERANSYPVDRELDRAAADEIERLEQELKFQTVRSENRKRTLDVVRDMNNAYSREIHEIRNKNECLEQELAYHKRDGEAAVQIAQMRARELVECQAQAASLRLEEKLAQAYQVIGVLCVSTVSETEQVRALNYFSSNTFDENFLPFGTEREK